MVVDFPAPFGPTKPVTWPAATVNVIPSSASVEPNRLRSPATSMVASLMAVSFLIGGMPLRNRFYSGAGLSTVLPADTCLIPAA